MGKITDFIHDWLEATNKMIFDWNVRISTWGYKKQMEKHKKKKR